MHNNRVGRNYIPSFDPTRPIDWPRSIPRTAKEAVLRFAEKYDIAPEVIAGKSRLNRVARARAEAIRHLRGYRSMTKQDLRGGANKENFLYSTSTIGIWFGLHHTTVLYHLKRLSKCEARNG